MRASLMYAIGRAYGLPYKMATFIAKQGLFNTVNDTFIERCTNHTAVVITSSGQRSRSAVDLAAAAIPCPLHFFMSFIQDVTRRPLLLFPLTDPWINSLSKPPRRMKCPKERIFRTAICFLSINSFSMVSNTRRFVLLSTQKCSEVTAKFSIPSH